MPATAKPNPTPTHDELAEYAARRVAEAAYAKADACCDAYAADASARLTLLSDGTGPSVRLSKDGSRIIVEGL